MFYELLAKDKADRKGKSKKNVKNSCMVCYNHVRSLLVLYADYLFDRYC